MEKKRSSFIRTIQFWCVVFPIIIGIGIITIDLFSTYNEFNLQSEKMRSDYNIRQKQIIKHEVERVVDIIRYEKKQSEKLTKSKIKSRVLEAYSIAHHIYQENKSSKSKDEIQKMILDAIRPIRFDQGNGYYFISRLDGTAILFPSRPELERKNLSDVQDNRGKFITRDTIKIVKQSVEGFYQYHWLKPNAKGNDFKKISYVKDMGMYDWFIGTGLYVTDVENEIKEKLLSRISRIRFGKEGYIFLNTMQGEAILANGQIIENPTKMWIHFNKYPEKIKKLYAKEYKAALQKDGSYIYYSFIKMSDSTKEFPKVSFIYGIPEWQWIVGTGVYIDDIENDIEVLREELRNLTKQKIVYSILVTIVISIFMILFFNWLTRRFNHDLNLFFSFFNRAAHSDKKIERENIKFVELDKMAESANKMLTDRKHIEKSLLESEKKYRYIFEHSPAGIYEIDFIKNKFINVNENICLFSGYSEEEFLSLNPSDLLAKESYNAYIERIGKLTTGETLPGNVEYTIIKKDGQQLSAIINSDYIYEDGKLTGARSVAYDISELKLAQNEKIKAQTIVAEQKKLALVGQIAGKMAHDFNNILTIIMGNTELSLLDCNDAKIRKTLELIFEQTQRGKNLTKNLVAFAKDQEPKQIFFKLSEKVELVFNLLKKDLGGIDAIREDGHGVPDLLADPGMIEHALVNLIQNSIHATSLVAKPEIIVRTFCLNRNIHLEIKDNGCGIPDEVLDRIFEPAFTMKGTNDKTNSYKPGIKGTGYGMANVKKYIQQHKGNIVIDSKIGKGTTIIITFPVIKKELTAKEKIEIQNSDLYSGKYILVVEDEQAISDVQYKILTHEPCNHKVDIAASAQMAIDLFNRNNYDFISLDYVLPGKRSGIDVYQHIREINDTVPILFISGNLDFLESIKELKSHDSYLDHVSKPCQNKDYINAINSLLKRT